MKALRLTEPRRFGWLDIPEPRAPRAGEALVAVRAIGICGTDVSGYLGKMPFIQFPRVLGHELGVEVLAVGDGVTNVAVGDCCSVEPYLNCGTCHACRQGKTNCCETLEVLGVHRDGGMCERLLLPAHKLHRGGNLTLEQLALVETLAIGCHAVNRAAISNGDSALIIGAGPIGLSVLEFANLETENVSILELNPARRAFVERHYPNVKVLADAPEAGSAQIIFEASGSPASMSSVTRYTRFTGRIVFVGITQEPVTLDDPLFHRRELTLLASRNAIATDFTRIIDLIQRGVIDTQPWISHRAPFDTLPETFPEWLLPEGGVIKAVVTQRE